MTITPPTIMLVPSVAIDVTYADYPDQRSDKPSRQAAVASPEVDEGVAHLGHFQPVDLCADQTGVADLLPVNHSAVGPIPDGGYHRTPVRGLGRHLGEGTARAGSDSGKRVCASTMTLQADMHDEAARLLDGVPEIGGWSYDELKDRWLTFDHNQRRDGQTGRILLATRSHDRHR